MAEAKKSDIRPALIEDAEALRIASETMELARRVLVEGQNHLKDEMAGYQSAYDAAENKIRAHIMAGGTLPEKTHYKLIPVAEKETITFDQDAIVEFEVWAAQNRQRLFNQIQNHRKTIVIYDGEAIARMVDVLDGDEVAKLRFDRCKIRSVQPATTRLVWSKT